MISSAARTAFARPADRVTGLSGGRLTAAEGTGTGVDGGGTGVGTVAVLAGGDLNTFRPAAASPSTPRPPAPAISNFLRPVSVFFGATGRFFPVLCLLIDEDLMSENLSVSSQTVEPGGRRRWEIKASGMQMSRTQFRAPGRLSSGSASVSLARHPGQGTLGSFGLISQAWRARRSRSRRTAAPFY